MKKKSEREMICISCPIGCHLTAKWETETDIKISGNECPRGEVYGREEILAPKRVVTATVAIDSQQIARLPVKTEAPILKEKIKPLLSKLYSLSVHPPIACGDEIIENVEGTEIRVVATRSVET